MKRPGDNEEALYVYGKPVYYYHGGYGEGFADVMLSNGRRYFLSTFQSIFRDDLTLEQDLFHYFAGWHGYFDW